MVERRYWDTRLRECEIIKVGYTNISQTYDNKNKKMLFSYVFLLFLHVGPTICITWILFHYYTHVFFIYFF